MTNILYILLGIIVMNMLVSLVFKFLGIEFAVYGNYLLWVVALVIFYAVLPSSGDSIF
jgi:hypothetical protein